MLNEEDELLNIVKIIKAFKSGKKIESKFKDGSVWSVVDLDIQGINTSNYDYRIEPESKKRPMTLDEIIEWRKNSNGVILWQNSISMLGAIDPEDKEGTPLNVYCEGWRTLKDFIKYASKSNGEKFEVEE